jgi:ubiquinone/menaquinone biosynthesis C-methylase UbiE
LLGTTPMKIETLNVQNLYDSELARIRESYADRAATIPAERYSLQNLGTLCMVQERQREMLLLLQQRGGIELAKTKILEIGCGNGFCIRDLIQWGARPENITGLDLLPSRIVQARELCPARVKLVCDSAHRMKFADESFDLVAQFTMLTSVLDDQMRSQIASEVMRVLRPGGSILWYDFRVNNPLNRDTRGITAREIRKLFAGCDIYLRRTTVVPPLARIIGRRSALLYLILASLKVFSTHYVGLFRKR